VRRLAAAVALGLCLAGCGGASQPKAPVTAILTAVQVRNDSIVFDFRTAPDTVNADYGHGAVAECGSGAPIRLPGTAALLVHFLPAMTHGVPRRLPGAGSQVLRLAKFCDFEADVGWAVALDRRRPFHVSRDGATVTVTFE
jgi:hypothetical protein